MLYIFDPQSKIFGAKKKKNLVPRGGGGCIFKETSLEGGYPMYHRANNTTERERRMEEREREGKGKCRGVGFHTHHFVRKVIYYLLKRSCNFLAWYTTSGKIISAAYALCISVLCLCLSRSRFVQHERRRSCSISLHRTWKRLLVSRRKSRDSMRSAGLYLMRWIMATSVQLFNWTKFTQVYIFGIERKGDTRSMNDEWKGETKYKTKSNLFRRSVDKLFLRR